MEQKIEIIYSVLENEDQLPESFQDLLKKATEQLKFAYAPYSNFYVGAALLTQNDKIYVGSNLENAASPMCICAEGALLTHYNSLSHNEIIKVMAITAKSKNFVVNQPVLPCGACRQMISEIIDRQKEPISLILKGEIGAIYYFENAQTLLPLRFTLM